MCEHAPTDNSIVRHGKSSEVHLDGERGAASSEPTITARADDADRLTPPRRFLLCLHGDSEQSSVETISADQVSTIDPADVQGFGLEFAGHAVVSLRQPGGGYREMARCRSAESALALFDGVWPLRLVFLDPA